ncbi:MULTISPECIES: hypothetical protein [Halomonadaceae]|uniref:hypothetical protein n=1 Tax=Halomonadaceae TaxID=28256 RepID=UPI0015836A51|nr:MULTISPECIES: hypothetical protein [Halomonas]MDI4638666.1 hypothetical protein [Halomonas sp. BMC7]NUJ59652.1 hypothetical protein [Halomonas taeanensis]
MVLAPISIAEEGPLDIVMVAHQGVRTTSLNRDTARAMFAMRQRTWPDGQVLRVLVLPNDHPVHERFAKQSLSVYPHQLQLSWDRVVFSGTGQAPTKVISQPAMLERIATTPGSLGYLDREYLDDRVQVISME